jgi:hypothetical protein
VELHLAPWQSPEWPINSVLLACYKSNTLGMYFMDIAALHQNGCLQATMNHPMSSNLFTLTFVTMHAFYGYAVCSANGLELM